FEDPNYPDKVYKMVKALYGLHQAPRACQDKYVAEILRKFGFTDVKSASTPFETENSLLNDPDGEDVNVHIYRSMIGSLMYLTSSRPDIMFVVYACARFQVTPKVSHFHAVKRIFRYLKSKPYLGLWYPRDSPFNLIAYSDSNYARASWIPTPQKEAMDEFARLQRGLDEMTEQRSDGILYYLDQIYIPLKGEVRTLIIDQAHKLKYSVHLGDDKMYYDLRDRYWWPGMKNDIA
nr:putative ribonuclease H-like domain-containing protein [Tanacetum cinerariifolium]